MFCKWLGSQLFSDWSLANLFSNPCWNSIKSVLISDNLRHFSFDPTRFQSNGASAFRAAVRCIAGLGEDSTVNDCLQSSLPSELIFNDMRDTCRRAKKSDRTTPSNLHSVACKSVSLRTKDVPTVELTDSDWATPLPHGGKGGLKTNVMSALRSTDKMLGVSTHGLTKVKTNRHLTKPWVMTSRFAVFDLLCEAWHNSEGNLEEKATKIHDLGKAMWICKLFQPHIFIRFTDMAGEGENNDEFRHLIIAAGPNSIKALRLKHLAPDDSFVLVSKSMSLGCTTFLLEKIENIQVGPLLKVHLFVALFFLFNLCLGPWMVHGLSS